MQVFHKFDSDNEMKTGTQIIEINLPYRFNINIVRYVTSL